MDLRIKKLNSPLWFGIFIAIIKVSFNFSAILSYSDLMDDILTIVACVCLVFYILTRRYYLSTLLIYCLFTIVALYSVMQSGEMIILFTLLVCFAIRDCNFDEVIRFIYTWELIYIIFHTVYSIISYLLFDTAMIVSSSSSIFGFALCFGFGHRNVFAAYTFNLILMWIWLHFKDISLRIIGRIFIISTIIYVCVQSRTAYIDSVFCCLFLLFILKSKHKEHPVINIIAKFICPILCALTMIGCFLYLSGNSIIIAVDRILTSRLKLGAYGIVHYGITLFGQYQDRSNIIYESDWGLNSFTYDNIYSYSFMNIGAIWIIIVCIGFYLLSKRKNIKIDFAIIVWSLYAVTEVHGLNGFMCFPILLLSLLLSKNKNKKKVGYLHQGDMYGF